MQSPIRGNPLCGALVRLFKYLIPAYFQEFASGLRQFIITSTTEESLVLLDPQPEDRRPDFGMRQLYGDFVFPTILTDVLNVNVFEWKHAFHAGGARMSLNQLRGELFAIIYKLILRHEDKPIITRFFLFASCTARLLLCKLLGLPVEIFQTNLTQPQLQNAKRLKFFREFYIDSSHDQSLRVACLCLQLTQIAVSISSKDSGTLGKIDIDENQPPVLLQLAQGRVQEATPPDLFVIRQLFFFFVWLLFKLGEVILKILPVLLECASQASSVARTGCAFAA